jgi:excisionase family DNA binding protein
MVCFVAYNHDDEDGGKQMPKYNIDNLEEWMPMAAVEKYLCVSRETILQYINKKGMPAHKLGRQWRFKISEVDEWLRSGDAAEKEDIDSTEFYGGRNDGN